MRANLLRPLAGALSGLLWAASYPPLDLAALAWLALVPLFVAVRGATRLQAFLAGAATWCAFWPVYLGWGLELGGVGPASWGAAIAVTALGFGGLGWLLAACARGAPPWAAAAMAAAWVVAEKLRLVSGFASIPWGLVGESQAAFLPLIQLAALTGTLGLSFLVVWVNAALAESIARRAWPRPGPLLAAAATALAGVLVLSQDPVRPTLRVGLVQAGVYTRGLDPPAERLAVWERYLELSRQLSDRTPELIAWPSSSVPTLLPADLLATQQLASLARDTATFLLVGSAGQEKRRPGARQLPFANSAFLISPRGELAGRYDKIRLLPFNEYVPLRGWVRWPGWIAGDVVDARSGTERTVFTLPRARFAVLICWENFFPDHFRASAARGVDFVVSMTNEAFTRSTAAHRQMLAINVLRAVENGVSIVRPATTGLSSVIDARGRIVARVEDGERRTVGSSAAAVADVALDPRRTLYTRAGDWFVYLVAAPILVVTLRRRGAAAAPRPR